MEYKELIAAFAAKCGIEGLSASDGAAVIEADGVRVELIDEQQTGCVLACAEIGHPPPDADGAFGSMMLQANFLLRIKKISRSAARVAGSPFRGAPSGTPASPCGTAQQGRKSRPVIKQHNQRTKC